MCLEGGCRHHERGSRAGCGKHNDITAVMLRHAGGQRTAEDGPTRQSADLRGKLGGDALRSINIYGVNQTLSTPRGQWVGKAGHPDVWNNIPGSLAKGAEATWAKAQLEWNKAEPCSMSREDTPRSRHTAVPHTDRGDLACTTRHRPACRHRSMPDVPTHTERIPPSMTPAVAQALWQLGSAWAQEAEGPQTPLGKPMDLPVGSHSTTPATRHRRGRERTLDIQGPPQNHRQHASARMRGIMRPRVRRHDLVEMGAQVSY